MILSIFVALGFFVQLAAALPVTQDQQPTSICGQDDRVLSSEARVGRVVESIDTDRSNCTATLIGPSCILTAGHCAGIVSVLEFNAPASAPDGSMRHPGPEDQYFLSSSFNEYSAGELGDDWAVARFMPNKITGRLPGEVQGWFAVSFSKLSIGSNLRLVGYGMDYGEMEFKGAQKQSTGPLITHQQLMSYNLDTVGGNSGSALVDTTAKTPAIVGIHNNGGCSATGGANSGTAIAFNKALQAAIRGCLASEGMERLLQAL